MSVADHFNEDRSELLYKFIEGTVLGNIITTDSQGNIQANAIPFTLHYDPNTQKHSLQCHFPKQSEEQLKMIQEQPHKDVLVVFSGPESYISANWHPSKHETHKIVPTWNYSFVHVVGKVTLHEDVEWVRNQLTQLTAQCEALVGESKPWKITDSPTQFINTLITTSLVGMEISIDKIQGKMKNSQNKPEGDQNGVIANLQRLNRNDSANMVKHNGIVGFWDPDATKSVSQGSSDLQDLKFKLKKANMMQLFWISIVVALLCALLTK